MLQLVWKFLFAIMNSYPSNIGRHIWRHRSKHNVASVSDRWNWWKASDVYCRSENALADTHVTYLWIQLSLESLFFPSQRKSFYTEKWNCKKRWSVSILTRPPLEQALGIYSEAQPEWQTAEWLLCTYQLKCQVRQTEINSGTLSRRLNNRDVGRKNHWGVWKGTNEVNLKGGDCSNVGTISFWIPNWFFMAKTRAKIRK